MCLSSTPYTRAVQNQLPRPPELYLICQCAASGLTRLEGPFGQRSIEGRSRVTCLVSPPARQPPTLRLSAARTVMSFLPRIVPIYQGLDSGDAGTMMCDRVSLARIANRTYNTVRAIDISLIRHPPHPQPPGDRPQSCRCRRYGGATLGPSRQTGELLLPWSLSRLRSPVTGGAISSGQGGGSMRVIRSIFLIPSGRSEVEATWLDLGTGLLDQGIDKGAAWGSAYAL
jgi:hypothetical protein